MSETKDVVEGMARALYVSDGVWTPESFSEKYHATVPTAAEDARIARVHALASLDYLEKHFRERADQYLDEAFRYPLVWSANYIRSLRESSGKERPTA